MAENNTRAWVAVLTKGSASLKKKLTAKHGDKPEFQRLLKSTGQDKETWYKMHQKKQARLRGEDPASKEKERKQIGLKAWGATKGTRMGGEEGGGLTTDAPKTGKAVVGQYAGAGPVKTLSVAEYMKQKEEEQRREKAKAILAARKDMREESEQTNEAATSDNPHYGYHGTQEKDADKKYSAMHTRVKRVVGAAGHLSDVKKPNVVVRHYLDSKRGRHAAGRSDGYVARDFAKFKKTYNPEMHEESEQIDELSKSTLRSYRGAAKGELVFGNKYPFFGKKATKRREGIARATKKIGDEKTYQFDEGVVKKLNKRAKRLIMGMKGREKLGPVSKDLTWQQNVAQAVKAGRKMNEEMQHIVGVTVSEPSLKSAEPMLKKVRVKASSEQEAIKKAKSHYRKYGFKVHDAYHHSTITTVKKAGQMDEGKLADPYPNYTAKKIARAVEKDKKHKGMYKKQTPKSRASLVKHLISMSKNFYEEAEQMNEEYVIHKGKHEPGRVSSLGGQTLHGVTVKDVYKDKKEAQAHADAINKGRGYKPGDEKNSLYGGVLYQVSPRKKMQEEAEQIDELKRDTLISYVGKARAKNIKDSAKNRLAGIETSLSDMDKASAKVSKRSKGISRAYDRLNKIAESLGKDAPFEGPYRKASDTRKDEYGNVVKNRAKFLAKKALAAQEKKKKEKMEEAAKWRSSSAAKPDPDNDWDRSSKSTGGMRATSDTRGDTGGEYNHSSLENRKKAQVVAKTGKTTKASNTSLKNRIRANLATKQTKPNLPEEVDQMDEASYMGKGNHKPGWMLRADPELARKFKEIEQRRATIAKWAGKSLPPKEKTNEAKLDKVGKETADIDNDKDVDKTDMYLHNRRGAIKKAILKKKLNEGKAAAAADKAIALKRGKGNKINRKPTMEVDLKAQPSIEPTHSGEDDSANVKV